MLERAKGAKKLNVLAQITGLLSFPGQTRGERPFAQWHGEVRTAAYCRFFGITAQPYNTISQI
jgi:hypothetical protein